MPWHADVVDYAERWANAGKTVIVAALDGTFQRKPFNHTLQLIPLAEEVSALSSRSQQREHITAHSGGPPDDKTNIRLCACAAPLQEVLEVLQLLVA